MTDLQKYSFRRGMNQVPMGKVQEVRLKIMDVLGIKTRAAYHYRLQGKIIPLVNEYDAITEIFHEYGITDIWGE